MTPDQTSDVDATRATSPRSRPGDGERTAHISPESPRRSRWLRRAALIVLTLLLLSGLLITALRLWMQHAAYASLPRIDGTLRVEGLAASVNVLRDGHGVPSIRAASLEDMVLAQGYITAQDRLFQMDTLRRHAAGELAEILGPPLVEHDRAQRILQIGAAADRALRSLPPDQLHWLELYARGVNASIKAQGFHLPIEFRILGYVPRPWTPRDSVLVGLVMFQDLTNSFPEKLDREALTARLDPALSLELRAQLLDDLYPVGSWRDHPPTDPHPDLTNPVDEIPDIPLDDSQVKLRSPLSPSVSTSDLTSLNRTLGTDRCRGCRAGSNNWAIAGTHTASGAPLLSNDMHLTLGVPGLWYAVDLESPAAAEPLHVAGVSLPGTPSVIVGHNAHVAWGFTNLGADVQDLYIEHVRNTLGASEFQSSDGVWHPLLHQAETIRVRGHPSVSFEVQATMHGDAITPIISPLLPSEGRAIALRWTIYDPANVTSPFLGVATARSGAELVAGFGGFGGPAQNLIYADDGGHIGYHAVGRIPIRGSQTSPAALSPIPTDALASDAREHEWAGYIPFEELPQIADPPDGVLVTANARITPRGYRYPVTLNWADPYRNERIWKLLGTSKKLGPADLLAIQTDITSEPDRLIAQRLAYAIDHSSSASKRLRQAADLLRAWDGRVSIDSSAAAITDSARAALWPMLLRPRLIADTVPIRARQSHTATSAWQLYSWGERSFVEEQIIAHRPARWLPSTYASWDELLAAAVEKGLTDSKAPANLARWHYGNAHPVDLEHPLFAQIPLLGTIFGLHTGTGAQPQSGDGTTIKQVGHTFGPSERFTADLHDPDASTLNLVLGESGNPASPWFLDQFADWLHGKTYLAPFSDSALRRNTQHMLLLQPAP